MAKVNKPAPWECQEKETPKPYAAFCIYRDMGAQRSVRKVAEKLGKSETLISRWSSAHNWVERAAAWDSEQDRIARQEQLEAIKRMRKRQAESGHALQCKALLALKKIPADELSAQDIVKMLVEGSKLERISRGDVGEVIEERDGGKTVNAVQFYIPDNGRDKVLEAEDEDDE